MSMPTGLADRAPAVQGPEWLAEYQVPQVWQRDRPSAMVTI